MTVTGTFPWSLVRITLGPDPNRITKTVIKIEVFGSSSFYVFKYLIPSEIHLEHFRRVPLGDKIEPRRDNFNQKYSN